MTKKAILLILSFISLAGLSLADTVYLKSGQTVEGEISQEAEDYIKVNLYGVELTYYKDQISQVVKPGRDERESVNKTAHSGKSLCWKFNSARANVYVLGSIHVGKKYLYPLNKNVTDAFGSSDTLVVEANVNDVSSAIKMMEEGIYTDGQSLREHLKPKTLRLLEAKLNGRNLNFNEYAIFKPWFISLLLMSLELKKLGFDEELGIDKYFLNQAAAKKILELEGVGFQIKLFNEFSNDLQEIFIVSTLMNLDNLEVETDQMLKAWMSGDAAEVERVTYKSVSEYPELYEKLFYERNKNMASKIEGFLKESGNFFVVVGAGHLVGAEGIIKLLEQKGYAATQL